MAIVLLQSASHRAAIVVLLRRSLLQAVGSWPFGGLEIHYVSPVSGNDITVKNKWDSYNSHKRIAAMQIFLHWRYWEGASVSYLELLGLSSHTNGIHHGDKDGYVTQRTPDTTCYTDTQRLIGTFSEFNCSGVLFLWSCKEANMQNVRISAEALRTKWNNNKYNFRWLEYFYCHLEHGVVVHLW